MDDAYEQIRRDFHWDTPAQFNFGATVDSFAADPSRVALLWEDQAGNRARLTFADIRDQSNRVANVLTALGIKRGDPVMIVLPRVTLWQSIYIGGAYEYGRMYAPDGATVRAPSITRLVPEMRLAIGLDRKTTPCATSAGVPNLPVGLTLSVDLKRSGMLFSMFCQMPPSK